MRISNATDLGMFVRERRKLRGLTQAGLAAEAGVSRRWLADLEGGKSTVEVGLVFETLAALRVLLDARPVTVPPGEVDLDAHLAEIARPLPPRVPPSGAGPGSAARPPGAPR